LTSSGRPKSDGDQPAIRLHRRTDRSDDRLPRSAGAGPRSDAWPLPRATLLEIGANRAAVGGLSDDWDTGSAYKRGNQRRPPVE
jgi:hypothetical protein